MAKDYFQDIVPPHNSAPRKKRRTEDADDDAVHVPINMQASRESDEYEEEASSPPMGGRSIRNIAPSAHQRTRSRDDVATYSPPMPRRRGASRMFLWGFAIVSILILVALLFVAFRPTRVTIEPRTHALTFNDALFTAYPESAAQSFTYGTRTIELEDSEVIQGQGTVYAEDKASGNITVYNNYQTEPLKLVKNTRFETASGLIFRAPSDIVVPGKKGAVPGSVTITVIADKAGDQYNVAPGRFTVPGLKSTAPMYAQVYAESKDPFTGGFAGERPGVDATTLERAISSVRSRLDEKALDAAAQIDDGVIAFSALAQVEFTSLPHSPEAGGGVRVKQKARVIVPVFEPDVFIQGVASTALDSTGSLGVRLIPGEVFTASTVGTSTALGSGPLNFALRGSATLVWSVDIPAIQRALAGKDKSAFETVISGFSQVQEARARIQPFWSNTFPAAPEDIKITVVEPESGR